MTEKHQCCERVYYGDHGRLKQYPKDASFVVSKQCTKNASFVVNGKHYCKTHNPEIKAEKEKVRNKKWSEKWELRKKELALAGEAPALLSALKAMVKRYEGVSIEFDNGELSDAREAIKKAENLK